jgi:hypothetical protein
MGAEEEEEGKRGGEGKAWSFWPKVPMDEGEAREGEEDWEKMRVRRMVQSWLPDARMSAACG